MAQTKTHKKSPAKAKASARSKPAKKPAPKPKGKTVAKPVRPAAKPAAGRVAPAKAAVVARPGPATAKPGTPAGKPFAGKPVLGKPGSPAPMPMPTRAPARAPERAEELKAKIGALASAIHQIKALKRTFNRSFYEVGEILRDVRDRRLYEAKGYGSFEAFVEREIDLGKQLSLKVVRVVSVFLREAAVGAGLERASLALAAFDGESEGQATSGGTTSAPSSAPPLPARSALPPHKV